MEVIRNWNNLENQLFAWCNDKLNLPSLGQPWHLKFSAFKTDKCMNHPQVYHLDVGPKAYCYKTGYFPFSMMIGIEDYTFIDYKDNDDNYMRVCLQRGDMFLFRGDVCFCSVVTCCMVEQKILQIMCIIVFTFT